MSARPRIGQAVFHLAGARDQLKAIGNPDCEPYAKELGERRQQELRQVATFCEQLIEALQVIAKENDVHSGDAANAGARGRDQG